MIRKINKNDLVGEKVCKMDEKESASTSETTSTKSRRKTTPKRLRPPTEKKRGKNKSSTRQKKGTNIKRCNATQKNRFEGKFAARTLSTTNGINLVNELADIYRDVSHFHRRLSKYGKLLKKVFTRCLPLKCKPSSSSSSPSCSSSSSSSPSSPSSFLIQDLEKYTTIPYYENMENLSNFILDDVNKSNVDDSHSDPLLFDSISSSTTLREKEE